MDAGTAPALTASTPQCPAALRTSSPSFTLSKPFQASLVNNQVENARMNLVFDQNGITTFIDVAIVHPFSSIPGLIAAASARAGYMAKRDEKIKFERYPHLPCPVGCGDHRPCQEVHQVPHDRRRPTLTRHQ